MSATILGIESSCDDTSIAILKGKNIRSNVTSSQLIHAKYGGVIPEIASRMHIKNIIPVFETSLNESGNQLSELDAIAVTNGPGLLGSLLVGHSFAKSLALSLSIPLIEVNHMEAHVMAHFIEEPVPKFPFLCLTVSGGHTQIVIMENYLDLTVIGQTRDDAAGEAFDKTGKLLGLPYPSGPLIDAKAKLGKPIYKFTKPKVPGLDFSFSGLKTAILYFLKDNLTRDKSFIKNNLNDICCSVQHSIISILIDKLMSAIKLTGIKHIGIAGGVSANSGLRQALLDLGKKNNYTVFIPKIEYCTDNAAMIAKAGVFKFENQKFSAINSAPKARLPMRATLIGSINKFD